MILSPSRHHEPAADSRVILQSELPPLMAQILDALSAEVRLARRESTFQASIERALELAGIRFLREYRVRAGRLDFLCPHPPPSPFGVAIEAKTGGSRNELIRQSLRYLDANPFLSGLIIATTRSSHCQIPTLLASKPVRIWLATYQ